MSSWEVEENVGPSPGATIPASQTPPKGLGGTPPAPHCPRVPGPVLLDTVVFGLLCDPRCALYSLWSGSLSSHNQAEPGPTGTPVLAPQLQLNLLNLTSQANFTPWPESGAFPRLGRVAPALTGPWGQKGGTGPEVLVPR